MARTPSEHLFPASLGLTVMVALPSTELFGVPPPPLSSEERGTTIAGGQKDLKRTFLRMKIDLRGPTTRNVHMGMFTYGHRSFSSWLESGAGDQINVEMPYSSMDI